VNQNLEAEWTSCSEKYTNEQFRHQRLTPAKITHNSVYNLNPRQHPFTYSIFKMLNKASTTSHLVLWGNVPGSNTGSAGRYLQPALAVYKPIVDYSKNALINSEPINDIKDSGRQRCKLKYRLQMLK